MLANRQTVAELKRGSGAQFTSDVVEVFIKMLEKKETEKVPKKCRAKGNVIMYNYSSQKDGITAIIFFGRRAWRAS